jgi:hypothetical protein
MDQQFFKGFILAACLVLLLCSCGLPGSSPPAGYLAASSTSVGLLQFTEDSNHHLHGQFQFVQETTGIPPQVQTSSHSFTGTHDGDTISVTFSGLFTSATLVGTWEGDTITLSTPQADGTLTQTIFHAASLDDYNNAVAKLKSQVSQDDDAYNRAQATQSAQIASKYATAQVVSATATAVQVADNATATALQAAQAAVASANQHMGASLSALSSDEGPLASVSFDDALSAYARDWKQMQSDYSREVSDSKNGCGSGNYNYGQVQYDMGNVDYDYGNIQYDDGSLNYDKNGYGSDLQTVQSDEQGLKDAWTALQQADAANPSYTPAMAYSQGDEQAALNHAGNVVQAAQALWTKAKASASSSDSQAAALKQQADALPATMHCQ